MNVAYLVDCGLFIMSLHCPALIFFLLPTQQIKKAGGANEEDEDVEYWTESSEKDADEEHGNQTDAKSGNGK